MKEGKSLALKGMLLITRQVPHSLLSLKSGRCLDLKRWQTNTCSASADRQYRPTNGLIIYCEMIWKTFTISPSLTSVSRVTHSQHTQPLIPMMVIFFYKKLDHDYHYPHNIPIEIRHNSRESGDWAAVVCNMVWEISTETQVRLTPPWETSRKKK